MAQPVYSAQARATSTVPQSSGQPASSSVSDASHALLHAVLRATQTSNRIPTEEFDLMKVSSPDFRDNARVVGKMLMDMANKLLAVEGEAVPREAYRSADPEDVVEMYEERVSDVVDEWLDSVSEFTAARERSPLPSTTASSQTYVTSTGREVAVLQGHNVLRPQHAFGDIDNSTEPFVPKITTKPNALKPLDPIFTSAAANPRQTLSANMEKHLKHNLGLRIDPQVGYPHPYEYELHLLEYPEEQLRPVKERLYQPFSETGWTWVATEEALRDCVDVLKGVKEFAVDLEQHYYRSYLGFCCLMQISTRTHDYLIDTLELRSHMHILNEVFTDASIVKVFHGANSDIEWLQRDFGLYVVNMFDTGQASRVMEHPKFSLAYLLQHYCNVTANKQHQLADWRVRPLTPELVEYARSDTHYLLYIYDRMRNELIAKGNETANLLRTVLNQSRDICLRRFEKPQVSDTSHMGVYNKSKVSFNDVQMRVLKALYAWREDLGRQEDESVRYVLPNHLMLNIAQVMPSDIQALYECCKPTIPPLIRAHSQPLLQVVLGAKQEGSDSRGASKSDAMDVETERTGANGRTSPPGANRHASQRHSFSPGPSTEELYAVAGWSDHMQALKKFEVANGTVQVAEANQNFESSKPLKRSLFRMADDDMAQDEATRRTIELVHSQLYSSFGMLQPETHHADDGPSLSPKRDAVENADQQSDSPPSQSEDESTHAMAVEDEPSGIPKSIAEIFELSNRNRKRNKEKKRMKEESTPHDATDDPDGAKNKKKDTAGAQNTEEFLRTIGWVGESGSMESRHRRSVSRDESAGKTRPKSGKKRSKSAKSSSKTYPPPGLRGAASKGGRAVFEQFDYQSAAKEVVPRSKSKRRDDVQDDDGFANIVTPNPAGRSNARARSKASSRSGTLKGAGAGGMSSKGHSNGKGGRGIKR